MGSNDAPPNPAGAGSLAAEVWTVLSESGYRAAAPGRDGFEVYTPTRPGLAAVLVCPRYDGPLRYLGTPSVRRAWLARYARAIEATGLTAVQVELGASPLGLMAARDRAAAQRAAADAVATYERGN